VRTYSGATTRDGIAALVRPLLGHRIESVHRWFFFTDDHTLVDRIGPLELSFENGLVLTVEEGRNSEFVHLTTQSLASEWPAGALERIVRVDVSGLDTYQSLPNGTLLGVVLSQNQVDYLTAVQFVTDLGALTFLAEMDESRVREAPGASYRVVAILE
jgi:hypothetical protein